MLQSSATIRVITTTTTTTKTTKNINNKGISSL